MKALLTNACVAFAFVCTAAPSDSFADTGLCYSPEPICMSGAPACICNIQQQCWWACVQGAGR